MIDGSVYVDPYGDPSTAAAAWAPVRFWNNPTPFVPDALTSGEAVLVAANHGRWVVQCPDCPSAQLTCQSDPRFMCTDCANAANNGDWRPVSWPGNAAEIGAFLDSLSTDDQRNWSSPDTLADLLAANAAPVPAPAPPSDGPVDQQTPPPPPPPPLTAA